MNELQLKAPAKINLTLDVCGKRPDGYHELATVMHQITLADDIKLTRLEEPIIRLSSGSSLLPDDRQNLAYRAAEEMLARYAPDKGIQIAITKRIPIAAGLAGGSTDAAAVIKGINQLFALHLSAAELCERGLAIGSDVPFCVVGGTAFCTGRGEIMQPLPKGPVLHLVLVKPDFSLSTAAVYRQFDSVQSSFLRPQHETFQKSWETSALSDIASGMANVLEAASFSMQPEIPRLLEQMLALGALAARMTGSGPTVFGIFPDEKSAYAAFRVLSATHKDCFLAESL